MAKTKQIQKSKEKEKYLVQGLFKDGNPNSWCLDFKIPQRFGGKRIRHSLFTEDILIARQIRDKYIVPILVENSAIAALEAIGKSILQSQKDVANHIPQIKNIIEASDGMSFNEALDRYKKWMNKSSGLRPATIQKYSEDLKNAAIYLGKTKSVGTLTKSDAAKLRDSLINLGKSPTTISNTFATLRGFLRWLLKEGLIGSPYVVDNFMIDLPAVYKENTTIVPPSLADEAMNACPGWIFIPRILRYTGMRIGEVDACLAGHSGCGIVEVEGFQCFKISKEFCKTHADRFVPVCDKLRPYLTVQQLAKAKVKCKSLFAKEGRKAESPDQKKYNKYVKKIKGLEKISCHSWRVYAQTMMVEAGIDDLIVRRIVGHKDQSNVHYGYTAGRIEAMKKALDKIP